MGLSAATTQVLASLAHVEPGEDARDKVRELVTHPHGMFVIQGMINNFSNLCDCSPIYDALGPCRDEKRK